MGADPWQHARAVSDVGGRPSTVVFVDNSSLLFDVTELDTQAQAPPAAPVVKAAQHR